MAEGSTRDDEPGATERDGERSSGGSTPPAYGHLYGAERSLDSFLPLQDVVLAVDETFLEALRDFAAHALDEMRRQGGDYDHLHFRDVATAWHETWPDIILVAPRPHAEPDVQPSATEGAPHVPQDPSPEGPAQDQAQ